MPQHALHYTLTLALPRARVFDFFADAGNLARITPPELDFSILTPPPILIGTGTLIEYRLKLFGVPFHWKTGITEWSPPDYFVDQQLEGPYRQWIHRHTFTDGPDGTTVICDDVRYRLPLHPFGELAYPLVRRQLQRIFDYRQEMVKSILFDAALK